jgi:hypothetical protein
MAAPFGWVQAVSRVSALLIFISHGGETGKRHRLAECERSAEAKIDGERDGCQFDDELPLGRGEAFARDTLLIDIEFTTR